MLTLSNSLSSSSSTLITTIDRDATYNNDTIILPPSPPLIPSNSLEFNQIISQLFDTTSTATQYYNDQEVLVATGEEHSLPSPLTLNQQQSLLSSPLFGATDLLLPYNEEQVSGSLLGKPIDRPEFNQDFLFNNNQDSLIPQSNFDLTVYTQQDHSVIDHQQLPRNFTLAQTNDSFSAFAGGVFHQPSRQPLDTTYYQPQRSLDTSSYRDEFTIGEGEGEGEGGDSPNSCPELELSPFIDPAEFEFNQNISPFYSPTTSFDPVTTPNAGDYLPLFPGLNLDQNIVEVKEEEDEVKELKDIEVSFEPRRGGRLGAGKRKMSEEEEMEVDEAEEEEDDYKPIITKKRSKRSTSIGLQQQEGLRASNGKRIFNGSRVEEARIAPDAPIQQRKYQIPSRTSRKAIPVSMKRAIQNLLPPSLTNTPSSEIDLDEVPEEIINTIDKKRTVNTLAARKSRERKAVYLKELEDKVKFQDEVIEKLEMEVVRLKKKSGEK